MRTPTTSPRPGSTTPAGQAGVPADTRAAAGTAAPVRPTLRGDAASTALRWALLVASVGLLLQGLAYWSGWTGGGPALALFYVGHVVLTVPFALLMARDLERRYAVLASLAWGLALYLSWFLSNPLIASRFDETLHVATLSRLAEGGGFFEANPMLPVSPYYPGLELAAGSVHWLTGLPLMASQVVIVVLARCLLLLALFWLAERLTRSTRVATVSVFLYGASSQFWFFNAQFSYQTLALPLLLVAVLMTVRAVDAVPRWPVAPLAGAAAALGALTITHHLTSWIAVGVLWTWGLVHFYAHDRRAARLVWTVATGATLLAAAWAAVVGPMLWDYLGPVFQSALGEVNNVLGGEDEGRRELFSDEAGQAPTPLWERAVMFGSMLSWCLLLVPSGWAGLRGRTLGLTWGRFIPLTAAAVYPALLLARVSPTAADIAERASSFVLLAVAVVVAAWLAPRLDRVGRPVVATIGVVLVLGGTILGGGPDWSRVPGPYLASAEQRSIDANTLAVARWMGRYAPEGARFAGDTTMNRFLPDFLDLEATTDIAGSVNVTPMFANSDIDARTIAQIRSEEIDFIVADNRLAGEPARSGQLFEGSNDYGVATVSRGALAKFRDIPGATVVLSGPVSVYDVRAVRGAERTWADRAEPTLPGPVHVGGIVVLLGALGALGLALRRRRLPGVRGFALERKAELQWAVLLPAFVALGVVATLTGFSPWLGSACLVGLTALAVRALRRGPTAPPRRQPVLEQWVLPVATTCMLAAASLFAVAGAWQGLVGATPDMPRPGGSAADIAPAEVQR